jgi:hypothetical protein
MTIPSTDTRVSAGFTPGPWLADPMVPDAKGAFYIVGNLDGNNATVDVATVGPTLSPRAEANALLIAAAPDLYEALELVEDQLAAGILTAHARAAVAAALTKARAASS